MGTSKQLITALEQSDWLDRMLIISGLIFFLLVVAFILKQRIVDRGLRVAFWWTRFIPDFSGDEALVRMEAGDIVKAATGVVSTVASSVAAPLLSGTSVSHTESATVDGSLSDILSTHLPEPIEIPSADVSSSWAEPTSNSETRLHDEM